MLGNRERMDEVLFVACSLRDLVPDDYILKKVDRVLDLGWARCEVADLYCADNGRPKLINSVFELPIRRSVRKPKFLFKAPIRS